MTGMLRVLHRWLGIAGCLLFVMWFSSGLVMTQVGFPNLTEAERLHGLGVLAPGEVVITPDQAMQAAGLTVFPRRIWLESLLREDGVARPVWRMVAADGSRHAIDAVSGQPVDAVAPAQATAIARAFSGAPAARWLETVDHDAWTLLSGLDRQRPFHRIALDDAAGTELYVSARSGEVVRDTTRRERLWNWLGAVPHWLYFPALREQAALWRQVLLWASGLSCTVAFSGLVLGVLRLRRARSPYRGWMKLHHVAGLSGGVLVFTWITSGWLSMSPADLLHAASPDGTAIARYAGHDDTDFPWPSGGLPALAGTADMALKEVQLNWIGGRPRLTLTGDSVASRTTVELPSGEPAQVSQNEAEAGARALFPEAPIVTVDLLTQEDTWWYSRRDARELPAWRVTLGDEAGTWLHIGARDGRLLGTMNRTARLRRWLFNAPHTLELPGLTAAPTARSGLLWLLALLGLTVPVSGAVIGWRRLRGIRGRPVR
ncbi:MAG TPA: hypothetical protein VIO81_14225 [Methyloversatilis sp.]